MDVTLRKNNPWRRIHGNRSNDPKKQLRKNYYTDIVTGRALGILYTRDIATS